MTTDKKHTIIKIAANLCRLLLGCVFVFSGFVKAIDPLGFFYKLQDYLTAFGLISLFPSSGLLLLSGISLSVIEFAVGIFLLLAIRKRLSNLLALLLLGVMTPLTLYVAIVNPVSDCGCFGDAWVLTNWQTFFKNLFLLSVAYVSFRWQELQVRFITPKVEWMISMYTFLFTFALSFYCLNNLPLLDFRPYKIGTDIRAGREIPEGAKPIVYESRFVLEKEGQRQVFTLDNYPDSTWTFVETRSVLKEKGYEPPIHDFFLTEQESGEDITETLLADEDYTFLLVGHRIEEADDSNIDLINEVYDYSVEHGYSFYALTASSEEAIELWRDQTGAEYPFCLADEIMLKTIIRSNPGLLLLKGGVGLNKWSDANLPDEYVLTDALDKLELGQQKQVSNVETIAGFLLIFFIPLMLVVALDVLVIKRRERMAREKVMQTEESKETNINI